jgi:hypothetical protein
MVVSLVPIQKMTLHSSGMVAELEIVLTAIETAFRLAILVLPSLDYAMPRK